MDVWHCALWGGVGGVVVELYDIVAVVRATHRWPWLDVNIPAEEMTHADRWNSFGLWLFATAARIAAGGGGAAAASSQITGELAAFGLGVAGPLALERILAMAHINSTRTTSASNREPPDRSRHQMTGVAPGELAVPVGVAEDRGSDAT